ncbi:unnamed protein product [Dibothriocephalus latus]|uniref:Thiopurine S-methyltransferase n=1 Tax=Dibothriocephalus latus TaxID=60516 RepID=A0A3P7L7I9_DIBLA|nr:unnamed protein product [Dibothriocephalus latus]
MADDSAQSTLVDSRCLRKVSSEAPYRFVERLLYCSEFLPSGLAFLLQVLIEYWDKLHPTDNFTHIYVPLCGKTVDMRWLYQKGVIVVGSDFVEEAAIEFVKEHPQLAMSRTEVTLKNGEQTVVYENCDVEHSWQDAVHIATAGVIRPLRWYLIKLRAADIADTSTNPIVTRANDSQPSLLASVRQSYRPAMT